MIEYEVIVLDVDPETAMNTLNHLVVLGWTVKASYAGNRVILERETPSFAILNRGKALRATTPASEPTDAQRHPRIMPKGEFEFDR